LIKTDPAGNPLDCRGAQLELAFGQSTKR